MHWSHGDCQLLLIQTNRIIIYLSQHELRKQLTLAYEGWKMAAKTYASLRFRFLGFYFRGEILYRHALFNFIF